MRTGENRVDITKSRTQRKCSEGKYPINVSRRSSKECKEGNEVRKA